MLNLIPRFPISNTDNIISELPDGLQKLAQSQPTLARIYAGRGILSTDELNFSLNQLLPADSLLGIDQAVSILDKALDNGKKILIVGDFDCDGATSTALMIKVLSAMGQQTGAEVNFVVPDRFKYGYGLTPEIVELGIHEYNPDLIITVDNGISSHDGVEKAHEHGIEVIITDHHLTTKPTPGAEAVVNPNQLDCSFESKSLVGVGVAFYVLGRLAKLRREANKSSYQVSKHIDLVALGTVADVGILDQNNRILVHHGIQAIRNGRCSIGILALLEQAGKDYTKLITQDFGFVIAPRINAAGRMDSMRIGIECLLTDDWRTAQKLAYQLDNLNKERRAVEGKMREEADKILATISDIDTSDQQKSLVLYQDNWHQGVIGIVAGRLKESHYCPAIVFAPADIEKTGKRDMIKGSARSIAGIHIRDAIELVAETNPTLISHFGGHAMAAGLTIEKKNLEAFSNAFNETIKTFDSSLFSETSYTDGELSGRDFSLMFAENIQEANIWGHGFVTPAFDGIFEVLEFKVLKDKHLKLQLRHQDVQYPINGINFNYDSENWDYRAKKIHLLFQIDINNWNGRQSIQLMIQKLKVMEIIN